MTRAALAEPETPNSEALSANLFAFPECTFTAVSLTIPPGMKFERWEALGTALRAAGKGVQFWIGDWIRYGEHEYGEKYSQAIEATGKQLSTLQGYVYVAEHIDPCRRRQLDSVDFSTHAEVASLPDDDQERILAQAEAEPDKYTVKQVRREVHRVKRQSGKKPSEIEAIHTPEVQAYLKRYIDTLKELEEAVPLTAKFLRNMVQNHTAQAHWQKTRTIDADCEIIQQAVRKSGGEIAEDDLYRWLLEHGYFISDPEFEERLEYMNRDDVRMALVTSAGREGKQEDRRGSLPSIIVVPWVKIWDQASKRERDEDDED